MVRKGIQWILDAMKTILKTYKCFFINYQGLLEQKINIKSADGPQAYTGYISLWPIWTRIYTQAKSVILTREIWISPTYVL